MGGLLFDSIIMLMDEDVVCPQCDAPYHQECWEENQGCCVYGCPAHPVVKSGNPAAGLPTSNAFHEPTMVSEPFRGYAGFWKRVAVVFIDGTGDLAGCRQVAGRGAGETGILRPAGRSDFWGRG